MRLCLIAALASFVLAAHASTTPLVDGRIDADEWTGATVRGFDDGTRLMIRRVGKYVYIGVHVAKPDQFGLDLYLKQGPDVVNLHASAKLGERKQVGGKFPEWQWWNNRDWVANVGRIGEFQPRVTFLPDEAKEFQIASQRFSGKEITLRFEKHGASGTAAYPREGWLTLALE
jgi:hypothetical protein